MKDSLTLMGMYLIYDADTGELLASSHNMVVQTGRTKLLATASGSSDSEPMATIALGTGTTTVSDSDTSLVNQIASSTIVNKSTSGNTLSISTFFSKTLTTTVIKEAGVFGSSGTMYSRSLINYDNTAGKNLTVTYLLTLTNN